MSASFIAVLILMKVLEISAIIFVPWLITRLILFRFFQDIRDLFVDPEPIEHFAAWASGFFTIIICFILIGGGIVLWEVNVIWLTALLG